MRLLLLMNKSSEIFIRVECAPCVLGGWTPIVHHDMILANHERVPIGHFKVVGALDNLGDYGDSALISKPGIRCPTAGHLDYG